MKCYPYESVMPHGDTYEFVIFAANDTRAAQLLTVFRAVAEKLPDEWHPEAWEAWGVSGKQEHMDMALASGVEGLGSYDPRQGWRILSPDAAQR